MYIITFIIFGGGILLVSFIGDSICNDGKDWEKMKNNISKKDVANILIKSVHILP
jgi:hypothetical protein